jgi:hypothetical protein
MPLLYYLYTEIINTQILTGIIMINFDDLSLEVFQVLRTYANDIVLYDDSGNRVMEPSLARRFYLPDDGILVTVLDDNDNSAVKVYLGGNITVAEVNEFVTVLRHIATQYNVLFNLRKYNKRIVPKDFATQAAVQEHQEQPENSNMNIMEGMYGTSRSSYLKLENARMIVRHSARVKENVIGSRGRAIQSIFVENALGERFLFPVNILSGARAMTQHVSHGGTFADEVGQHIIKMAQDFSNLSTVANHIYAHQGDLPEQALTIRESIRGAASNIKRTFERLSRDNGSYIRESAKLKEGTMLSESDDYLDETIEELQSFLAIEGVTLSNGILESVCKLVKVEEDMRPTSNTDDTSADDDQEQQERLAQGQEQKPVGVVDDNNKQASGLGSGENGAFHEDEDMEGDEESEDLAENNPVIREFNAWLESFDEEQLDEGLLDQIPDDFEAEEDWVYDNQDAITNELHTLINRSDDNPAMLQQYEHLIMKGIRAMKMIGAEPMDLGFDPDSPTVQKLGLAGELDEASVADMSSGGYGDKQKAKEVLAQVLNGQEPVEIRGKEYRVTGNIKASQLVANMKVLASYSSTNQGVDAVTIDGFVLHVNGGEVHASSLKELAQRCEVKSLSELEKLGTVRIQVADLDGSDSGDWYYLFKGRFRRGSGAEALSFYTLQ